MEKQYMKVAGYAIGVVYQSGPDERLDNRLKEAAGRASDHYAHDLGGGKSRNLIWDFDSNEFRIVIAVATRMSRIMPRYVNVCVYIVYEGAYKATRLDWHLADKEFENAGSNQDDQKGTGSHE